MMVNYDTLCRRFPKRIPVVVTKASGSKIVDLQDKKFLAPKDLSIRQFQFILRRRLSLEPHMGMFVFIKAAQDRMLMPAGHETMGELGHRHGDKPLAIVYSGENTFG